MFLQVIYVIFDLLYLQISFQCNPEVFNLFCWKGPKYITFDAAVYNFMKDMTKPFKQILNHLQRSLNPAKWDIKWNKAKWVISGTLVQTQQAWEKWNDSNQDQKCIVQVEVNLLPRNTGTYASRDL